MTYRVKLFEADVSPADLQAAEGRFRAALEGELGGPELVVPLYRAAQRILHSYGEDPADELLTEDERMVFTTWRSAERAAVAAAFGPNRYMGDAMYEIHANH
ncbi:MAG: hypothetical protein JWP65_2085 [Ramlibacter sp.]|jgi:hypothetical protein|uniref:hypothetical protein n=1 Tax=Ramlibacter sp. TaxID=1917967 RepID=UPI00260FAF61|nr:hypothetical protein [Ramlibacter sp.]MDB5751664.1 hypothetical protein [Ramlibacter sp.]